MRATVRSGLTARRSSGPIPMRSRTPVPKLATKTSHSAARRRTRARPSGLDRSIPTLFFVLSEVVEVAVAVGTGGKIARVHRGAAGEVEPPRRLDLEHLRPEGAEDQGAVRAGPHPGEVEDPDPAEGTAAVPRPASAIPARGVARAASRPPFVRIAGRIARRSRSGAGPREQRAGGRVRLAEGGGGTGEAPPGAPEAVGRTEQIDAPRAGVVQRHEEVARPEVLLLREARVVEHRRRADPDLLEGVEHLFGTEPAGPRRYPLPKLGRMLPPGIAAPERRARAPLRLSHQREHPLPLGLLRADDEHLAVTAWVEAHRLVDGAIAPVVDAPRILEGG